MSRWFLLFCLSVGGSAVSAQQDSLMLEAVRLATEGQDDTAQAIVRNRMRAVRSSDPAYPEILFTAGVISRNPDSARAYFRRVSIEYSASRWADQSLLRIAQLAYGTGDFEAAERAADRVLIDYPFSEIRAGAAFLLARMHLDRRDITTGCTYLAQARRESGDNVELANRAAFYIQRCENAEARPAPNAAAPDTTPAAHGGAPTYSVQVAAVSSVAATDEIMRGLQRAGYTAEVIREGGLFKVRVGRFVRREQADQLRAELLSLMGGQPFVVESR